MPRYCARNPSTGELLEEYSDATDSGIEQMLQRSARGFARWRAESFSARASVMIRVAERLEVRLAECARLMALEMGKPVKQAEAEAVRCAAVCRFFASEAEALLAPEPRPASDGTAEVRFDPLGTVLAIMPWNFPFWQVFRCAAPTLMAGNAIVLKHAPNTPGCARIIAEIFEEAGAGDGVFENAYLSDAQAAAVIADRRIVGVSLTGSVRAGKTVGRIAGENLKRCILELGGSDPFIVCADANFEKTVSAAVDFRCLNNGQSCISPKRIFVELPIYDQFVEAFVDGMKRRVVGDPQFEESENGPMAREDLRAQLLAQVRRSVEDGAKLLCGGEQISGPGFFVSPGVLVDAPPGSTARREEIFGPIGVLVPFRSDSELADLANDSEYGLGASIWSSDLERGRRIASSLEAGNIFLNGATRSDPMLPFGGLKHSGTGRELGREGIREFVNVKTVVTL